jgi:hypothetical protein
MVLHCSIIKFALTSQGRAVDLVPLGIWFERLPKRRLNAFQGIYLPHGLQNERGSPWLDASPTAEAVMGLPKASDIIWVRARDPKSPPPVAITRRSRSPATRRVRRRRVSGQ